MILIRAALLLCAASSPALACPEGQSRGALGWCYPNIGGDVGKAWEKGKDELKNFENDVRIWIETGKCGGDICDVFSAVVEFTDAQVQDIGPMLGNAFERLSEGKPLDAFWHLITDPIANSSENAASAAQRSRVLAAAGAVAATVYGRDMLQQATGRLDPWTQMAVLQASGQVPRDDERAHRGASGLCETVGCPYAARAACVQPFCPALPDIAPATAARPLDASG